ncbi:MAG: hypothetical protein QGH94_01695 [Phycisphaerae bacterium]|jgi:hypothetical protein|nr:hypothetical protein [Phycisphaerae bacterium]
MSDSPQPPALPEGQAERKSNALLISIIAVACVIAALCVGYYFLVRDLTTSTDQWWSEIKGSSGDDTPITVEPTEGPVDIPAAPDIEPLTDR